MKIIEDISYSIGDAISQVEDTLGFSYNSTGDLEGYIILGSGTKLVLKFSEESNSLESATVVFPSISYDLVKSPLTSDLYQSSIESADQIFDLINRMLGGSNKNDEDI